MKKAFAILLGTLVLSAPSFAETIKAEVNGLVCSLCAQGITKNLTDEESVSDVYVNLDNKLVAAELKPEAKLSNEVFTKIITEAGYTVVNIKRVEEPVAKIKSELE